VIRATARLTLDCDNRCVFCAQEGIAPDAVPPDAAAAGTDEITFVGGEPLLAPALAERVAGARRAGYRRVGIQTNGRGLATRATELAGAGLTDLHVSIHGAVAAVHDYHTGIPGSHTALLAGVAAARAAGITVVATTVLTRSNFRVLAELPSLLHRRGIAAWCIAVPHVAGRAVAAFDRVVPRLGLAVPFALHALSQSLTRGVPAWIRGAPLCALGPLADRALPDDARAYAPVCAGCPARAACPGLDAVYLARFGGDELSPREPMSATDDHAALRRMFVGAGALARPVAPVAVADSPRAARARLPVLGKSAPGRHEAPRTATPRTGAALQEVFPQLFDGDRHSKG
jgi:hypothetical protein